jgi:hypothetical protein
MDPAQWSAASGTAPWCHGLGLGGLASPSAQPIRVHPDRQVNLLLFMRAPVGKAASYSPETNPVVPVAHPLCQCRRHRHPLQMLRPWTGQPKCSAFPRTRHRGLVILERRL